MLLVIFLVQGVMGFIHAWRAVRMTRPGQLAAGNYPELCVKNEQTQAIYQQKIFVLKRLTDASESASMFYVNRVTQELASELAGFKEATARPQTPSPAAQEESSSSSQEPAHPPVQSRGQIAAQEKKKGKEDRERMKLSYKSIVRLVLLESAPSLNFTVAFFCLELDKLGPVGKAKTILSTCASATVSLALAVVAARGGGWKGKMVCILIILMVFVPLCKMVFAFICASHFFSAVTFRCVDRA